MNVRFEAVVHANGHPNPAITFTHHVLGFEWNDRSDCASTAFDACSFDSTSSCRNSNEHDTASTLFDIFTVGLLTALTRVKVRNDTIALRPHSTLALLAVDSGFFSASPTRVEIRNKTVALRQHLTGCLLTAQTRVKMRNDNIVLRSY